MDRQVNRIKLAHGVSFVTVRGGSETEYWLEVQWLNGEPGLSHARMSPVEAQRLSEAADPLDAASDAEAKRLTAAHALMRTKHERGETVAGKFDEAVRDTPDG